MAHYSRSDFARETAGESSHRERPRDRPKFTPLPDLRFEPTYLRKVGRHVRVERAEGGGEIIHVEWNKVFWATVKDQVVAPLIQGMIWCVL